MVGIASEVRGWWLRVGKSKISVASSKMQVVSKGRVRGLRIDIGRSGLPLNGSPFSEKNGCKFLDASYEKKKENLFLRAIK